MPNGDIDTLRIVLIIDLTVLLYKRSIRCVYYSGDSCRCSLEALNSEIYFMFGSNRIFFNEIRFVRILFYFVVRSSFLRLCRIYCQIK